MIHEEPSGGKDRRESGVSQGGPSLPQLTSGPQALWYDQPFLNAQLQYLGFELAGMRHYFDEVRKHNPETPVLVIGNGSNGMPPVKALESYLSDDLHYKVDYVKCIHSRTSRPWGHEKLLMSEFDKDGTLGTIVANNPLIFIVDSTTKNQDFASSENGYRWLFTSLNDRFGFQEYLGRPDYGSFIYDEPVAEYTRDNFPGFQGIRRLLHWRLSPGRNNPAIPEEEDQGEAVPWKIGAGDAVMMQVVVPKNEIEAMAAEGSAPAAEAVRRGLSYDHRQCEISRDSAIGAALLGAVGGGSMADVISRYQRLFKGEKGD